MRVVHIAYQYGLANTGGAAIAASRLHCALLKHGIESHYVCLRQCEEGKNIHTLPPDGFWRKLFKLPKVWGIWNRLMLPMPGFNRLMREIRPNLIHVQWLNYGGVTLRQIEQVKCPKIVNLHDLWMLTSGNPLNYTDRRIAAGYNKTNSNLRDAQSYYRKLQFVRNCNPIFLGPSKWIADMAQQSLVAKGCKCVAISNLCDDRLQYFEARTTPHNKFIILFGCNGGMKNKNKGFDDLMAAIGLLSEEIRSNIILRVFGGDQAPDKCVNEVCVQQVGSCANIESIIDMYHGADVFAFPSHIESQGMTKVEALSCGLPVIAFDRTACAEGIISRENGWISADGDVKDFAEGIKYYYTKWRDASLLSMRSVISGTQQKSNEQCVADILSLYHKCMLRD